jgi:hypothetical protein
MANEEKTAATQGGWRPKLTRLAVGAGILIAVFLAGYVPSCTSARQAQQQQARLESQLALSRLQGQLGMASYEANRNNYASAAQLSTDFFNGLREAAGRTNDEALRQKLQALGARRDEVTANLAEPNPAVKEKLQQMYADLFQITSAQSGK